MSVQKQNIKMWFHQLVLMLTYMVIFAIVEPNSYPIILFLILFTIYVESELKRLFATPVKMLTPFKIEETYSHERILDSSVTSIKKCCDTMKGNAAAESMPDEEVQNAGYEVENNFSIGTPLSDNGGDDICEEIKAHNTSDGGNIQNTEAVVESCDADLQKLDLPAYSHLLTASSDDGNILREPSVQTSSDPEEENFGSCQKDVADKGSVNFIVMCSKYRVQCLDNKISEPIIGFGFKYFCVYC